MTKEIVQERPKLVQKVIDYFKDTRGELRKVAWPTRDQATKLTLIVLAVTIVMALFLGALDFLFANLILMIAS